MGDAAGYCKLASRLVDEGKIKPMPIRVWERGLEGVGEAMKYMIDGKVRRLSSTMLA